MRPEGVGVGKWKRGRGKKMQTPTILRTAEGAFPLLVFPPFCANKAAFLSQPPLVYNGHPSLARQRASSARVYVWNVNNSDDPKLRLWYKTLDDKKIKQWIQSKSFLKETFLWGWMQGYGSKGKRRGGERGRKSMRLKREQHLIFKNTVTLSHLRAKELLPANLDAAMKPKLAHPTWTTCNTISQLLNCVSFLTQLICNP